MKPGIVGFYEAVSQSSMAKQQLAGKRVLEMMQLIRDPVSYVEREQRKKEMAKQQPQQQHANAANSATQQTAQTATPASTNDGTVKLQPQPPQQSQQAQSAATADTKSPAFAVQQPKPPTTASNTAPPTTNSLSSTSSANPASSTTATPPTAQSSSDVQLTVAQEIDSVAKHATATVVHSDATRTVYSFRYRTAPQLEPVFPRVVVTLPAGYPHSASASFTTEAASNEHMAAQLSRSVYEHVSRALMEKVRGVHKLQTIVHFCQQSAYQLLKRAHDKDKERQAQLAAQQAQGHTPSPQPQQPPPHEQQQPQREAMVIS